MWQTEGKDFEIHKQNANPKATLLLIQSSFGDWPCGSHAARRPLRPPVSPVTGASGFLEQEEDVGVPGAGQAPPTLTTRPAHTPSPSPAPIASMCLDIITALRLCPDFPAELMTYFSFVL